MTIEGFCRGPVSMHRNTIPPSSRRFLADYYNSTCSQGTPLVYLPSDPIVPEEGQFISRPGTYFKYIIRQGRRITASACDDTNLNSERLLHSSMVKVRVDNNWKYGQILSIFEHLQSGHCPTIFAEIRWFKTLPDNRTPLGYNPWAI